MRKTLLLRLLITAMMAGPALLAAWAQEPASFLELTERRDRYTIEAIEAPLGEVMERLQELSGVALELTPGLDAKRVNLKLKKVKLEELIEALTDGYVLIYELVDGEYRISTGNLMDSFKKKLTNDRLSRKERREQERMIGEVKEVLRGIDTVHGHAGQLNYDDAKALIQQRKAKMEAYVQQVADLGPGGARAVIEVFPAADSTRGRMAMIQALGDMKDPNASGALGAVFSKAESFSEREEAVKTLNRRGDASAKAALVHIVGSEQDKRLRAKAIQGLSGHPSAIPVLGDLVASETENSDIRCEAIRSLGAIGSSGAQQIIARAAQNAKSPLVKKVASREVERSLGRQKAAASNPGTDG